MRNLKREEKKQDLHSRDSFQFSLVSFPPVASAELHNSTFGLNEGWPLVQVGLKTFPSSLKIVQEGSIGEGYSN